MALRQIGRFFRLLDAKSPVRYVARGYYLYSPEPIHPMPDRSPEWKSGMEAVQVVQSGETIFTCLPHFKSLRSIWG